MKVLHFAGFWTILFLLPNAFFPSGKKKKGWIKILPCVKNIKTSELFLFLIHTTIYLAKYVIANFVCYFSFYVKFHGPCQTFYLLFILPLVKNRDNRLFFLMHAHLFSHSHKQNFKMVINIVEAQSFAGLMSKLHIFDKLAAYC